MRVNHGEMQAMRESMQKKMSEAKTSEERQALMAEQQKLMLEKRAQMMSSNAGGHDMNRMPGNMGGQTMDHSTMDHAAHMKMMADSQRQAGVSERGRDVMPFSLAATTHIFSRTAQGGIQQVIAKKAGDAAQVKLVRQHLQEIRAQFLKGDFSGPSHIHGKDMPGLTELREGKPGQVEITYRDVKGGAELSFKTANASLVVALHKWFDAQLSDHGKDAKKGHSAH